MATCPDVRTSELRASAIAAGKGSAHDEGGIDLDVPRLRGSAEAVNQTP
jgi:hypothetical protein